MKKLFTLLFITFLLNGCAESVALLGTTAGGTSNGKMLQSSLHSVTSYGVKRHTGKTPLGHAIAYNEKHNPEKKKVRVYLLLKKQSQNFVQLQKNKYL